VETFGHHIQKIRLFDLGDTNNQIPEWDKKKTNEAIGENQKCAEIAIK